MEVFDYMTKFLGNVGGHVKEDMALDAQNKNWFAAKAVGVSIVAFIIIVFWVIYQVVSHSK